MLYLLDFFVLDWCVVCTELMCCVYWTGVLYVLAGMLYVLAGMLYVLAGMLYVLGSCTGLVWDHTCPIHQPVHNSPV